MLANHRGGFFFATIKPFIAKLGLEKKGRNSLNVSHTLKTHLQNHAWRVLSSSFAP